MTNKLYTVQKGYSRHQGKRERQRRLKQVREGRLKGPMVTEEARYAAFGLLHPSFSLGQNLVLTPAQALEEAKRGKK